MRRFTLGLAWLSWLACASALACRASHDAPQARQVEPSAAPLAKVAPAARSAPASKLAPATRVDTPLEDGLSARFYFVGEPMERIYQLVAGQTPNVSEVRSVIDIDSQQRTELGELKYTFLSSITGYIDVPADGNYGLRLFCDDGGKLRIDGALVIDHDGLHSPSGLNCELDLAAGLHAIEIEHMQGYGGFALKLLWKRPGADAYAVVPTSALKCQKGEVHVTSPGPKKVVRPLDKGVPGDGMPLTAVHPSYDLMTVRPEGFEPRVGGIAWLPDGRMVISTWDAAGSVYLLDGTAGDERAKIGVKLFASGLAEPLGVAVVEGRIFVLQKQELTELIDTDHDDVADEYRCLASGWGVSANFHEFAFGLVYKDGYFYFNLATAINPGGRSTNPQVPGRGTTLKVALADGSFSVVAHGERTPNGVGIGTDGEIFVTDNQGDWLPASKMMHVTPNAFFGSHSVLLDAASALTVKQPVLWLPQNEIGNSPCNPSIFPAGHGPYSGQMCHGDVTYGGVQRDFIEQIEGEYQGCVFRMTQGLESGVNRIAFGPDGALYVGGIGSTGDWGQEGKLKFGLQRLKYNGKPTFEMLALRVRSNGFEIEFTEPLAAGAGWENENWHVEQWRYVPTIDYGGPKIDQKVLALRSASVSGDRKRVFLELDGLKEGHVVHLHVVGPVVNERDEKLWNTEAWYTLNRMPKNADGVVAARPAPKPQNQLTPDERAQGWRLLFDGQTTKGWRGFKQPTLPAGWQAVDGTLARIGGGGDIVTDEQFADFELALEWKIARGGNSGVFFHVSEDLGAVWESGPEMQVLDNEQHADGRNPLTSAGSNYALYAPSADLTRPVGMWNSARLKVDHGHVEHWLNGAKIVEYELGGAQWQELVAGSKFARMKHYGEFATGHIALQDHGDAVAYRNIKIRPIVAR